MSHDTHSPASFSACWSPSSVVIQDAQGRTVAKLPRRQVVYRAGILESVRNDHLIADAAMFIAAPGLLTAAQSLLVQIARGRPVDDHGHDFRRNVAVKQLGDAVIQAGSEPPGLVPRFSTLTLEDLRRLEEEA